MSMFRDESKLRGSICILQKNIHRGRKPPTIDSIYIWAMKNRKGP